jgi:heptosyltransferase-2
MKILIVCPSWLGDAVVAQSLIKNLKDLYPDSQIDALSPSWTFSVMKRMPEVSEVILFPFKHGEIAFRRRLSFGKNLSLKNYDWAILLPNSFKSAIVPFVANIKRRTGWLGEARFLLLNDVKKLNSKVHPLLVQRFCALANNFEPVEENFSEPSLEVNENNINVLCNKYNLDREKKTLILCPGAEFGPAKRWPSFNYAKLSDHYLDLDFQVIILGSIKDMDSSRELEMALNIKKHKSFFNLTGNTNLEDAIDILSLGTVVSNDSGLMHVAAALKRPQVALFGPTDPGFTPPLNNKAKIIRKRSGYSKVRRGSGDKGYHPSLEAISVQEVIDSVLEVLENKEEVN